MLLALSYRPSISLFWGYRNIIGKRQNLVVCFIHRLSNSQQPGSTMTARVKSLTRKNKAFY